MKLNCWEYQKCGREPGGKNVEEFGVCSASVEEKANGINSGKNGGRACWALVGTLSSDDIQTTFMNKTTFMNIFTSCLQCPFYKQVLYEEGIHFVHSLGIHHQVLKNTSKSSTINLTDLPLAN